MQQLVLVATVGAALAAFALLASRIGVFSGRRAAVRRASLGLVPGIAGALIVGVAHTDLIPDDFETAVLPALIVVGTVAVVALAWLQFRAR